MRISWSIGPGKSFGHVPQVGMTLEKFILIIPVFNIFRSGEPGLVDRVLALHAGSRGFDSNRGHTSERFFRSNRQGYPHPVSSELDNSGIRVAVGDCSVTERRRWRPPYQTGKTVHVHANTTNTTRTDASAGCVRQWFRTAEPLGERRYENWNTHTHSNIFIKVRIGEPGLVDRKLALHAGSRGFDSHRRGNWVRIFSTCFVSVCVCVGGGVTFSTSPSVKK